jgi:ribosome maturation factor RimP
MENIEKIVRKNAERFNMVVIEFSITGDNIDAILYRKGKDITVGDFEELTRLVQHDLKLIGLEGVYNVNFSTPGLDRVLKDEKEVDIFEGRDARITYVENGEHTVKEGILRGHNGDNVLFETDSGVISVPFSSVVRIVLFEKMFEKRKGGKK